jgi:hypothetical protein
MDEWEIDKPLGQCSGSGRKIEAGEEYFAALILTEQGFKRCDFSADYWRQNKPECYCYWKTKLPDGDRKKQIFVDDDVLMTFFERLATETEQDKLNFRFVLALVLMRRRRLKYESSERDGDKEIWRLRITGTQEFADVVNPNLDEAQVQQLSSQIGQILQAEL